MVTDHKAPQSSHSVLIVGNYCHDVLLRNGSVVAESLGGAASFISNVLNGLSISFHLIAKVGSDFKYPVSFGPITLPASKTTVFHAHFDLGFGGNRHQDRVLKRVEACDPIRPEDLPEGRFDFGMAVGVGGEILPETLERMVDICGSVFVDIQALIRVFGSQDGEVNLVRLEESGFYHLLPRIGFLKASSEEALFMDVEEVRKWCGVVVTQGKDGCKVYWKDEEVKIAPFSANQIDPTGAGDSFLGGFIAGLVQGLAVSDAGLLGNFFGSLTVAQIGLPKFDLRLLQSVKDELQSSKMQCTCCFEEKDDGFMLTKTGDEKFHAFLTATRLASTCSVQEHQRDSLPRSPTAVEQVICPQYPARSKLLLNPIFDDTVQTVNGKP